MPTLIDESISNEQWTEFDAEVWVTEGREISKKDTDVRWELGDWLLRGEPYHVDHSDVPNAPSGLSFYATAARITNLSPATLKDLKSTAKRFPASVRTDAVSWSHHRVLINARPEASDETLKVWLKKAVDEDLSVVAFREAAKIGITEPRPKGRTFLVTVPFDVWDTLKVLADDEGITLKEYAGQLLVGYAESDESGLKRDMVKEATKQRRRKAAQRSARSNNNLGLDQ